MRIDNREIAKVFEPSVSDKMKNTVVANLSTWESADTYSSWRGLFRGDAFEKAKKLKNKDSIVLTSANISRTYDAEKDTAYVNLVVFDFELVEEKGE